MKKVYVVYHDDFPLSVWESEEKAQAEVKNLDKKYPFSYYLYDYIEADYHEEEAE